MRSLAPEVILAGRRTKNAAQDVPCEQALQAAEEMLTIVREHYQAQGDTAILGPDRE